MDEPWGWQIDGHHRNLNDFVLKDQVVMTPAFWGAELATADCGPYAGLRECDAEQRNGLELIRALSLPQHKPAIIFKPMIATDLPPERDTSPDGCQPSVSFKDNVVQVKVVAIHLPGPWFVHGGRAKDAENVTPFPKQLSVAGDFPQHFVALHDVARRLEAPHAQAHPEQLSCRISLGWAHLVERHAVAQRMPNKPTCAWCCAVA